MKASWLLLMLPLAVALPATAQDAELPSGEEVARRINARDEGESAARRVRMELIDKRGHQRTRETRILRRTFGADRRMAIFYQSPKTVKDTAFLVHDHADPEREDDQWLYLPALRKVRRISVSDRGQAFLGTDLSYDDIKKEGRVSLRDYRFRSLGREELDGHPVILLEGTPVDERTARELGYGRVVSWVDSDIWFTRRVEYFDPPGRPLKTSRLTDVREVDGVWTAHVLEVENHKTGHKTVFRVDDVDYASEIPEDVFTQRSMRRGLN